MSGNGRITGRLTEAAVRAGPLLLLAAAAVLPSSPLHGQAVSVRVLAAGTADPVVGAVVRLVEGGTSVAQRLTNAEGRALFLDVTPGRYRLRAEMIGMTSLDSEAFEVSPDATVQRELRLESRPIDIEGIDVAVGERCRVRPREGAAVQRVWEEARKALEATALTDEQRAYLYRTMVYERDLDDDARTVLGEERRRRVATMRTPFWSRPADELAEQGYVRPEPEGDVYHAPDAGVLLSDPFLDTHCFRLERGTDAETTGLLGLAFEPLASRDDVVEIAGTLWLDPATSALRWLDFRYVDLDPDIRTDHVGGRVEFRRVPDGGWIVPEWWIRMPSVAVQRTAGGGSRTYVGGYREAGGLVLDVEGVGADPDVRTGAIEGVVMDSVAALLEGVEVEVVGTGRTATTDSRGRYRFDRLVEGTYRIAFEDPRLRTLGHSPEPVSATVERARTTEVDFGMPSAATVLARACRAHDPGVDPADLPIQAFGEGVLVGRVLDGATGEPLPGAEVRLTTHRYEFKRGTNPVGSLPVYSSVALDELPSWETRLEVLDRSYGLVTRADEDGVYRVCHVPERELLMVVAVHDGVATEADTLMIERYGGVLEHPITVPRRR